MAIGADGRVRDLLAKAGRSAAAGRPLEAQQIMRQIEIEAPNHPISLNENAQRRLSAGDPEGARRLLEAAVQAEPRMPILWLNLAAALNRLGLVELEREALEKLLKLDPRNFTALLRAGVLEETHGNKNTAAAIYRRAIENVPRDAVLPADIRAQIDHGQRVVAEISAALERFVDDRLEAVRARYRGATFSRFEKCKGAILQKKQIYRPKPTFMYFPELPAIEFFDRDQFPWLEHIEAATNDIRDEFLTVLREDSGNLVPYVEGRTQNDIFWNLNESRRWSVYYLWKTGVACEENLARCPKTAMALEKWPKCHLYGTAPSAVFSILDAKTLIPPHTGVNNSRLIVHLPLIVPENCWFRVGSEKREWRVGEALIFDDTIEHEAWNGSDVPRTVMIFDIWNPFVAEGERELVTALTAGVGEFYGALPF